ncbi:MAG: sigma-54-dependent Fis family transcriptional regulator [Ignavibacteriales bacterium]|nr:sigma-54-dependent Fis family transcriptional regulator [Ignavibacteriales bacterium]
MQHEMVLVIEDNDTMRIGIEESLVRSGYIVQAFAAAPAAFAFCKTNTVAAAIIDLKMEPVNGLDALKELRAMQPSLEAIMISAYGTVEDAVTAMQLGASDFLTKPFSPEELRFRVKRIFENITAKRKLEILTEQNQLLREQIQEPNSEIIGNSEKMQNVFRLINQVAESNSNVLITGESGTGKELVAKALHNKSTRSSMPFIKINCGVLNENLLESELFGHEKGAFTGAVKQKKGRFELAEKGTLFLDEIGDVSPGMQLKLLRVLQEREFERVGGEQTIATDVRILAATNKDIPKLIRESKFREDLYYRLNVIPLSLPALRERSEDIPLLANHFLAQQAAKNRGAARSISPDGMIALQQYRWPGNIRELENLIERLFVITTEEIINLEIISRHLFSHSEVEQNTELLPLEDAVNRFEKSLIEKALQKSDGVKNRAAKILGVSPSNLFYKLEKHGLL